jgi:D-beta-D-heptose 7-phosphate kinase/D-beta-D-heptose 1-phosphate adenosyltransferase
VPVVHFTREDARPGGAGNVVSNVRALGGRAACAGIVGDDAAGRLLARTLDDLGASTAGLIVDRHRPTIEKTRIIAHQQQMVRLDREAGPRRRKPRGRARPRPRAEGAHAGDVLVISDYNKGVVDPELLDALAAAHRRQPFRWVVDPKRANFPHYKRVSLVKPNREEAAAASGIEIRDAASLRRAGTALLDRWEAEAVLISRGEGGMALFKRGGIVREIPDRRRARSTT